MIAFLPAAKRTRFRSTFVQAPTSRDLTPAATTSKPPFGVLKASAAYTPRVAGLVEKFVTTTQSTYRAPGRNRRSNRPRLSGPDFDPGWMAKVIGSGC